MDRVLKRLEAVTIGRSRAAEYLIDFFVFGVKEARACIFAGSFFALLFLSHYVTLGLYRYDFLFVSALVLQLLLLLTKVETFDEFKTIVLFHFIGFALEVFKTHPAIGSWSYPEPGIFKLFDVPLYSGFMYAAVGSYIAQAWRLLTLRLEHYPPLYISLPIAALIYLNFFTHHFIFDFRYIVMATVVAVFWKTRVFFTVTAREYRMPLIVGFVLTAFFIWLAENIGTVLGAWKYPDQLITWTAVSSHKIGAWSLLVIISFILIAELKRIKGHRNP